MNNLLEVLVRLRDDLKLWVTNNLQALKDEIDCKSDFSGEYQDLSNKPDIDDMIQTSITPLQERDTILQTTIDEHKANNTVHVTQEEKDIWSNKSGFSGKYEDLINAPDISDDEEGDLKFVDNSGYIILKIDEKGLHTTNIEVDSLFVNGKNIMEQIESGSLIKRVTEEEYYNLEIIDPNTLYIIE